MTWGFLPALLSRPSKPVVTPPNLRINGLFFALETGERVSLIDATEFHLYGRMLTEGRDAIRPVFAQLRSCGYNMARVFTRYDLEAAKIGRCMLEDHPNLYTDWPDFVNMAAEEYGIYINAVAYTSWNAPDHCARLAVASANCRTAPIYSLVNELDQAANRTDPQGRTLFVDENSGRTWIDDHGALTELHRPTGLLCSHGSNGSAFVGDVEGVVPVWDWSEAHWNASSEWGRKCGHNSMEMADRLHIGIHASELPRYPDNCQDVNLARGAGENIALLCAGGTFHSVSGKRGLPWQPGIEADAARAFGEGARSIPADCQPFPYRHPVELEPPEWNGHGRVYQRGTQTVCIARIPPENFDPNHPPEPPTPEPEPPQPEPEPDPAPFKVGYVNVVSSLYGDHRAAVADFTTLNAPSSYYEQEPKAANGADSFATLAQERKFMLWWPDLGSGATSITPDCLASLDAMIPQWPNVDAVFLDEIPGDHDQVDRICDQWIDAVAARGLARKPLWVGFTVNDGIHGTGVFSSRIDVVVLEAYVKAAFQRDPQLLNILEDTILQGVTHIGVRPVALIGQGYLNGGWEADNLPPLRAMQMRTIEIARIIPQLQALIFFTLVREQDRGSLEAGLVPIQKQALQATT